MGPKPPSLWGNGRPGNRSPETWFIVEISTPEAIESDPLTEAIEKAIPGAGVRVISVRRAT